MRFPRLVLVVVLVTLCCGAFGAAVGALVGFAVPSALSVFFHTSASDAQMTVGVGPGQPQNMTASGAALGCAAGLVAGAMLGMALAALDQLLMILRERTSSRSDFRAGNTGTTT